MHPLETTTIEPRRSWFALNVRELWSYRELLYFLIWRDIKIRYKQTVIGIAWAVLQPVVSAAIFTVIFSTFAKFDTGSVPYPLFALSGLVIWLYVHTAVTTASLAFVNNTNLVTKVYFPRIIMPLATTLAGLADVLFGAIVLFLMMLFYGIALTPQIVLAPAFFVMGILLTASTGTLFSALSVRFRDVKFVLPFLLQIWMIASPVFYPTSLLGDRWRLIFAINPLTGILEGLRAALFGSPFDWQVIGISSISLVVLMAFSLAVFSWMEDDFADIV